LPSLRFRLTLAASLVLVAFLGLTGAALERAFEEHGLALVADRLQARIYGLLGAAELDESEVPRLPDDLPEPSLSTPASGLYAQVSDDAGHPLWRSGSMPESGIPFPEATEPGVGVFAEISGSDGEPLLALSYLVRWELAEGVERSFRFQVAEHREPFDAQLAGFRRSLWGWLAAAAAVLLGVQALVLTWSLAPLGRVARQVREIEAGRRQRLTGAQPRELRPLTEGLNALLETSGRQLDRYRNSLGDLAHALKTPLAVLRGAATDTTDGPLARTIRDQVTRMDGAVEHRLRRAAAFGGPALHAPVAVGPQLERLRDSLAKVYADRKLELAVEAHPDCRFRGDEGDLLEILGNLMDNACKWAERQVRVLAESSGDRLKVVIEDDGPGFPTAAEGLTERGARGDTRVPGQGIGLAVVRDLVCELYAGELDLGRSALGGARVRILLDPARHRDASPGPDRD
jgi:two-component system sensor histidine kinase PhoQ